MRVSELYADSPLRGNDVFLIGTGPSLGVMPPGYLGGRVCITLNDAWRYAPDAKPAAMSNNSRFLRGCALPLQICKGRLRFDPNPQRDDNHTPWDHPTYHVFSYRSRKLGDPWDHLDIDALWKEPDHLWNIRDGSISIFATQVAMNCGARSVNLVGCDACELNGCDYVESKRRGAKVKHIYSAYRAGLMRLAREGWKRRIPVVSVTPFMGLGEHDNQYREMIQWK